MVLDVKEAMRLEEDRARADHMMDMLMRDEEVREAERRSTSLAQ